jgi:hypothetical protein
MSSLALPQGKRVKRSSASFTHPLNSHKLSLLLIKWSSPVVQKQHFEVVFVSLIPLQARGLEGLICILINMSSGCLILICSPLDALGLTASARGDWLNLKVIARSATSQRAPAPNNVIVFSFPCHAEERSDEGISAQSAAKIMSSLIRRKSEW